MSFNWLSITIETDNHLQLSKFDKIFEKSKLIDFGWFGFGWFL